MNIMPYLLFLKNSKILNCRLLQIIGGALWVNSLPTGIFCMVFFCCQLIFFKINFIKKIFLEYLSIRKSNSLESLSADDISLSRGNYTLLTEGLNTECLC